MEGGPDSHYERPDTGMGGQRGQGFGSTRQSHPPPHLHQQPARQEVPAYYELGAMLKARWHVIVVVLGVVYFVYMRARNAYYTRNPKRTMTTVASFQEQMATARLRQQETANVIRDLKAEMRGNNVKAIASGSNGSPPADRPTIREGHGVATSEGPLAPPSAAAAAAFMARQREMNSQYPNATTASVTGGHRLGGEGRSVSAATAVPPTATSSHSPAASSVLQPSKTKPYPKASSYRVSDDSDEDNPRGPRKRLPKLSGGDRAEWEAANRGGGGDERRNYFKRDCGPKGG